MNILFSNFTFCDCAIVASQVYPKLEGSRVHVRNQCLDLRTSLSSKVVIHVSDIYSINVQVADKVGMYIGDWTPLPPPEVILIYPTLPYRCKLTIQYWLAYRSWIVMIAHSHQISMAT